MGRPEKFTEEEINFIQKTSEGKLTIIIILHNLMILLILLF